MDHVTLMEAFSEKIKEVSRTNGQNPNVEDVRNAKHILLLTRNWYDQFLSDRIGPEPSTIKNELKAFSTYNLNRKMQNDRYGESPSYRHNLDQDSSPGASYRDSESVGFSTVSDRDFDRHDTGFDGQSQGSGTSRPVRPSSRTINDRLSSYTANMGQENADQREGSLWSEGADQLEPDQLRSLSRSASAEDLDSQAQSSMDAPNSEDKIFAAEGDPASTEGGLSRDVPNVPEAPFLRNEEIGQTKLIQHTVTPLWQASTGVYLIAGGKEQAKDNLERSKELLFNNLMIQLTECNNPTAFTNIVAKSDLGIKSFNDKRFTHFLGMVYKDFATLPAVAFRIADLPQAYYPTEGYWYFHDTEKLIRQIVTGAIKLVRSRTTGKVKTHYKNCMDALGEGYIQLAKFSKVD